MKSNSDLRELIVAALSHIEAEDGLYFNNLIVVHEEEERPIVVGDEAVVKAELAAMQKAGLLKVEGEGEAAIYKLAA